MTSLIDQTIGNYQIIEEIGRGGMATVYRARQGNIERDVAVKVMPAVFTHDPTFLARFQRETDIAARLTHPRILPVYDYGEYQGQPFIVLAYIEGGTLEDRLASGPLPLEEAKHYLNQIAEGLDFLHREGVIHRDLKPSNVLIDRAGNVFLADFGVARIQEATAGLTGTGLIGTPAYMAPELFSGGEATPASDVYALAVILYQMLTGKRPFKADTPVQYMRAHLEDAPTDITALRRDLPPRIGAILDMALAKDPDLRPSSAKALARAVEAGLPTTKPSVPRPAPTRPVPKRPVPTRPPRRLPLAGIGGGVVVIGLLALGAIFLPRLLDRPEVPAGAENPPVAAETPLPPTPPEPTDEPLEQTLPPTSAPTDEPTAIPEVVRTGPPLGGGTGIIGFNVDGLGYTVDADCVVNRWSGCDPNPRILPAIGGVSPIFGAWSPDGSRIAFEIDTTEDVFGTLQDNQVYVVDLVNSGLIQIEDTRSSYNPVWSPDSDSLAYASEGDLYIADLACEESPCVRSGQLLLELHGVYISVTPLIVSWLSDGRILIVNPEITYHPVTNYPRAAPGYVTIHPDGSNIQFYAEILGERIPNSSYYLLSENSDATTVERATAIRITDLETGVSWPIMSVHNMFNVNINILPERIVIAYTSSPNALEPGELYLADITPCYQSGFMGCQDAAVQVSHNATTEAYLTFSPDGAWLGMVVSASSEVRTVERCQRHYDPSQPPDFNCGLLDVLANLNGDIYVLNVDQALAGAGETALTRITNLGFASWGFRDQDNPTLFEAFNPTWQPAPGVTP